MPRRVIGPSRMIGPMQGNRVDKGSGGYGNRSRWVRARARARVTVRNRVGVRVRVGCL